MKQIYRIKSYLLQVIVLVAMAFILSGCAGLNSNFSCSKKPGVMCSSLDQVNTMVDQGKIGAPSNDNMTSSKTSLKNLPTDFTSYSLNTTQPDNPLRYPETLMRIWVAPYEDDSGNYHGSSTLYTVAKKGQWISNL